MYPCFSQPVRVYIGNDDRTDYYWSGDGAAYRAVFLDMIDYYLNLADATATATNAPPCQSRFNCDGSFWLWTYEKNRTPAQFARLMERIKDGHFSASMTALNSCYRGQPAEAALRGLYYAGQLERRFQHRFSIAVAMENQTLPLGLASLWAGAGAGYSWRGVCDCATRLQGSFGQRPHEIYWFTGKDGGRILLKWNSLAASGNTSIGGYAEAYDPIAAIKYLSSDAGFLGRYTDASITGPYRVRAAFGFGWDALERKTGVQTAGFPYSDHFHKIAREQSTPDLQVIASNEEDFFRDFEVAYGVGLPLESVTYGNEWDLYSASMAETTARVRRSVEKLRAAEALATLVSLAKPGFMAGREAARDQAFMDLGLYWEHGLTADGPVSRNARAEWQISLAGEIESCVDTLYNDALAQLGALITNNGGAPRFFVFNPLGWSRTGAADLLYSGSAEIHVRDLASQSDMPHQFVRVDGINYLRILAADLPPVGYKMYEIQNGPGTAPTNAAARTGENNTTLENDRVKVGVDPDGAISSLVDKTRENAELAAEIGGLKLNDFASNSTVGDPIEIENAGPVSVTLKCVSVAGKNHITRITLYHDSSRVDLRNDINENFADVRQ